MTSWRALVTLGVQLMMPMACSRNRDQNSDLQQEPGLASSSPFESVTYSYSNFVNSGCGSDSADKFFLFNGDDLKEPIFASLAGAPKSMFDRSVVCKTSARGYDLRQIRLKIKRSDGSSEILASPDLGCVREVSPDLTGVIPSELLSELNEALQPKSMKSAPSFQQSKLAVYYRDERLMPLDLASFEALGSYAWDNSRVYFLSKVLESADRSSFTALASGWAKDQNHAYFNGEIVVGADPGSLTLDKINPNYAVDSKQVYYQGHAVPGVVPEDFACLDSDFCKNNSQVLFLNNLVPDVDAPSFVVDSCSRGPQPRMLCTIPSRMKLVCQVHDKNRSFVLEEPPSAILSLEGSDMH